MKWQINFYDENDEIVEIYPLHHEYDTDKEALSEAEDIADHRVDGEKIVDWTLTEFSKCYECEIDISDGEFVRTIDDRKLCYGCDSKRLIEEHYED